MKLILQLLLSSLIWTNSINSQILSTIGLYENVVNTYENGKPAEIDYFDEFGYDLKIKQKRYFYESGHIKAIGYYLDDNEIVWKNFDFEGNITSEEVKSIQSDIKKIFKSEKKNKAKENLIINVDNDIHDSKHDKINKIIEELLYFKNDSTNLDSTNSMIHEIKRNFENLQKTVDTLNLSIQDIDNDFREVVDMIFQEQTMLSERIAKLENQTKELKKNQPNSTWTNSNNRFLPDNIQKQNEKKWYQLIALKIYPLSLKIGLNAKYPLKGINVYNMYKNTNILFQFNFEYSPSLTYKDQTTQMIEGTIQTDLPLIINLMKSDLKMNFKLGMISMPGLPNNNLYLNISPGITMELFKKSTTISTILFITPEVLASIGGETDISIGVNMGIQIGLGDLVFPE
jgi:hypothetical protein